jgi:hypothetical protein
VFIIFISKEIYPTDGIKMGESKQIMQVMKRKASNTEENNRGNKKSTKQEFLVTIVTLSMTNFLVWESVSFISF